MDVSEENSPSGEVDASSGLSPRDTHSASIPTSTGTATVYPTTGLGPDAAPSAALNPRSCVTCRRRKVRCDKHMPCSNCRKAQIACIFPAPGRAPRRPRPKDPNAAPKNTSEREIELMRRLRKLEGIVEELSGQVEVEASRQHGSDGSSPEVTTETLQEKKAHSAAGSQKHSDGSPALSSRSEPGSFPRRTQSGSISFMPGRTTSGDVHKEFGRLVLNDNGKTRYISSAFWSKMNDELGQLREETQKLTDEDSDYSDDGESPQTLATHESTPSDHHAFIFGFRSSDVDLRKLHPLPSQIPYIWQVFTENVEPLVKLIHVPSMTATVRNARNDMSTLPPGLDALMFSIYFAAITSLDDDEVRNNFNAEKSHLIQQYRFATEQALAKVDFLATSELVVLQAFVLYLCIVRRHDNGKYSWTLTGLAIRIAQSLGLQRDGTNFPDLKPFEIEMRRRVWWQLCILDLRAAEDQGNDPAIHERMFDTCLPLNINDTDMSPEMTELPKEHEGPTDMTFSLIRYHICMFGRRMHAATHALNPCPKLSEATLEEREALLQELCDSLEHKFLKHCSNQDNPLHWVAETISRIIMAKLSLVLYQPALFPGPGEELPDRIRDRLFFSAREIVEYNKVLNSNPKCKQWRWLFQTYTQWHAAAYLLLECGRRPWSASVERGWTVLNASFANPDPDEYKRLMENSTVWLPLRKLMLKVRRHREAEVTRLRADPQAAKELDEEEIDKMHPMNFRALPSSMRTYFVQNQWRKLVGLPEKPPPMFHCLNGPNTATTPGGGVDLPDSSSEVPKPPIAATSEQYSAPPTDSMEFLDILMAQPGFVPVDLFPIAYQGHLTKTDENLRQLHNSYLGTSLSGDAPLAQQGLSPTSMNMNQQFNGSASRLPTNTQPRQEPMRSNSQPQPQVQQPPSFIDPGAASWQLWSGGYGGNTVDPSGIGFTSPVDDQDVNMDEDFNWQNWQESIKGFEAGMGLGGPGAFTGGI